MTEACHVSKHQQGRPAGTTGWWGIKCIWHNWVLWWCHDGTSSTDLASLHWYSTLFEEHRPCFLVAFWVLWFLKMPPWLVCIQQCRTRCNWSLDSSRSLWMWPEAVLCVHSVFGSSSTLHSLWYHCREGYQWGICITTAKSAWWSTLLLQLREFTPVGGNCKVYLPDKGTRSIWAAKGGWLSVLLQILYMYWCWNVNHAAKFKL